MLASLKWSSYRATAATEEPPTFLMVDWILSQADGRRPKAQRGTLCVHGRSSELREMPQRQRLMSPPNLAGIIHSADDNATIAEACREHCYTMKEIAEYLALTTSSSLAIGETRASRIHNFPVLDSET